MKRRGFLAAASALLPGVALADVFGLVPAGVSLTIGDPLTQHALALAGGALSQPPFTVNWANIAGGPGVNQAIRAHALDLGSGSNVPPVWAHWTGLDVKIVAVWERQDPLQHPIYRFGVAPGVKVASLTDLRGKRIAYAPGQAQGLLIVRALAKAGIPLSDVQLVQMPSTANVYLNALASHEVDVAAMGDLFVRRYIAEYGHDGASYIDHGLRDDINVVYGPTATLNDPAKADAVAAFVQVWAKAIAWVNANPQAWLTGYLEQNQGLSPADAAAVLEGSGKSLVPASWDDVIAEEQQIVNVLAPVSNTQTFDAGLLFDRRFEALAATAFAAASVKS
jgi:sulfonate transport system substrate-binding protein